MKVILRAACGVKIDSCLFANAGDIGLQFWLKLRVDNFEPAFRAEHDMHHVLRVGMGRVPHLRCLMLYTTRTPSAYALG